jgi:hypothetical protein
LFERACRVMRDGIRHQHPDLDDAGVMAVLRARLDLVRALERNIIAVRDPELDWNYSERWGETHHTCALLGEIRRSIPPA